MSIDGPVCSRARRRSLATKRLMRWRNALEETPNSSPDRPSSLNWISRFSSSESIHPFDTQEFRKWRRMAKRSNASSEDSTRVSGSSSAGWWPQRHSRFAHSKAAAPQFARDGEREIGFSPLQFVRAEKQQQKQQQLVRDVMLGERRISFQHTAHGQVNRGNECQNENVVDCALRQTLRRSSSSMKIWSAARWPSGS